MTTVAAAAAPPAVVAWRIYKPRFAATAWTGEGSRRFSGRFHTAGTAVVYAAGSYALAALETLVHVAGWRRPGRSRRVPSRSTRR